MVRGRCGGVRCGLAGILGEGGGHGTELGAGATDRAARVGAAHASAGGSRERSSATERDLLSAALGLVQVEARAERLALASKRRTHESTEFREQVLALLHPVFGDKLQGPFYDKGSDPEALYKVDALVTGTKKPLAIALVPGDLDAEQAVSAKLALPRTIASANTRWIAIPRDMERLTSTTRKRLNREYLTAGSTFEEDGGVVEARLRDLAEVA